ncbi:MAG: hypothetical protein R2851_16855 [Caldilineaceae bacterium]
MYNYNDFDIEDVVIEDEILGLDEDPRVVLQTAYFVNPDESEAPLTCVHSEDGIAPPFLIGGDSDTASCEVGTIPGYSGIDLRFGLTVSPFYLGGPLTLIDEIPAEAPICNHAEIAEPYFGEVGQPSAEDCSIVKDKADLRVTKIANGDTVQAGEPLEYWIIVENLGPSAARGVAILDNIFAFVGIPGVDGPEFTWESLRPTECGFIEDVDLGGCILGTPLEPMGTLPGSGRWTIKVVSQGGVDEPTTITNKVDVFTVYNDFELGQLGDIIFTGTPDPDKSNNSAITVQKITAVSDLGIEKEDLDRDGNDPPGEDNFRAGTQFRYGIEVTNYGPSIANNVVAQDPVPPGLTVVEIGGLPGSEDCDMRESFGNTVVTCNLGTLEVGESEDFYIIVEIDPRMPNGSVLINTACTYSDNFDPDNSDNCEEEDTGVRARSRIELDKGVSPGDQTSYAGEEINYNIYVYNDGPSTVRDLVIKDDFAADFDDYVELVSVNVAGGAGTCYFENFGRRSLICTIGDMDPGQERRIDFVVKTDPSIPPATPPDEVVIENVVYVAASGSPVVDDPADSAEVLVLTHADLSATKRSSELSPATGDVFFYTVEVTNNGPSTARDVRVDDELTGSVQYLYSRGVLCSNAGVDVSCDLGDIAPGRTVSFDIVVEVKETVKDGHRSDNVIEVTSTTPPYDQAPLLAYSEEIVFRNVHDLRIRKFGKPDGQAAAGEALVYTIIVDNFGPGRAWNIEVKDLLASDGDYSWSAPAEYCSPASGSGSGNTQIVCKRNPANANQNYLNVDDQWIFNVTVTAGNAQSINNVADVTADGTDTDNGNNSAIVEHGVDAAVNLDVRKAVDHTTVDAGGQLAYTIVVTNKGPSVATNVRVRDSLPAWVTLESITTNRGTCTPDDVTCVISTLNVNQSSTIQILVNVDADAPAGAHLDNTVRVTSDEYDIQASNNLATAHSRVSVDKLLRVTKEASAATVGAGERLDYRIIVENVGSSPVESVVIADDLPDHVSFSGYQISGGPGACTDSLFDPEVICELGTVAQGEVRTIFVTVQIAPDAPEGQIVNNLDLSGLPIAGDSTTTTVTNVVRNAYMRTEFSTSVTSVEVDEVFSYKVKVVNEGVGTLKDVRIDVDLPDLLAYVTDTAGCGQSLQLCALGDIPPGESREFEILVKLTGFAPNGTWITASVATTTSSGNVVNNGLLSTTVVVNTPNLGSEAIFLPLVNP